MRRTTIAMAIAAAVMLGSAARAGDVAIGTVTASSRAFVLRHGTLFPATPSVRLRQGDRLITRANGSATIDSATCTIWVGASTMLTAAQDSCARPVSADFEDARTGYAGRGSAFAERRERGFWIAGGVYALAFVATLYAILRDGHDHRGTPSSP